MAHEKAAAISGKTQRSHRSSFQKAADTLYDQYADLLRLRDEVKRVADSGLKSGRKVDRS
jgi:hypothetical protein